jgi:two-component system, LytTR family, response regulator
MIRERDRIRFIAAEDVDWIEGARNYVRLHVGERSHLLRGPLTAILAQLDPTMFARIHRSIIVNVERIGEVQPWLGGDYVAILRSGERLRVSRNFRDAVVRTPVKA